MEKVQDKRDEKFYKRLYFGLGYEYHAVGNFWRLGYEAFKIDADFGFDLLVYNQKERMKNGGCASHPYLIQVKAATVNEWNTKHQNAGERKETKVKFLLNKKHYDYLINEEYAYLLCYVIDPGDEKEIIAYFWLSHEQLKYLNEGRNEKEKDNRLTWFRTCTEDKNKVFLEACVHVQADLKKEYEKLIDEVEKLNPNLASNFKDLMAKSQPIYNERSHNYITLLAETNKGGQEERSLNPEFMKLSRFNDENIQKQIPFRAR